MPVTEQTPVNSSTGNGVTTVFPYTFLILAQADIEVYVDDVLQTLTTDYTVSGAGSPSGGNVTFISAPASGDIVVLRRGMAYERATDYQENGDMLAATLDADVDATVMMIQQLAAEFVRALKLPKGTTTNQELSGTAADRASKYLAFDSSGNLTTASSVDPGTLTVSAFMETLLDDLDALSARATLGFTTNADIASAATIDLSAATGNVVRVSGTTGTSAATMNAGQVQVVTAEGAWPLTHHATNMRLITLADYTCTAEEPVLFYKDLDNVVHVWPALAYAAGGGGGEQIQEISASVGASALTISAGSLSLDFRSTTAGSGTVTTVTGDPADLVVSSGSTLGTVSATPHRLWVAAINNAGTIELAVMNTQISGGIAAVDESGFISTTAEGGAGAADSAGVWYSTTARSNVAFRLIGYIESTQATAGTWATAPSKIQGMGPGVKKPGDVVQTHFVNKTDTFSTASTTFVDITGLSVSITPTSVANRVRFNASISGGHSTANMQYFKVLRDSTDILVGDTAGSRLRATTSSSSTAGQTMNTNIALIDAPGVTSATAYKVQMAVASGTGYVGRSGTDTDSAIWARTTASILVEEIQA